MSLLSVAFYEQTDLYIGDMKHHIYYTQISVPSSLVLKCNGDELDYCQCGEAGSLHEHKHTIRHSTVTTYTVIQKTILLSTNHVLKWKEKPFQYSLLRSELQEEESSLFLGESNKNIYGEKKERKTNNCVI